MGSARGIRGKTGLPMRHVLAVVLVIMCLLMSCCSPCEGRKLPAAGAEGGKVIYFQGGLGLRVPPPPSGGEEAAAVVPKGFTTRPERSMRSVPSPGVGH